MKPHTYFWLTLFTPFILRVVSLIAGLILSEIETLPAALDALLIPIMFYTIGIILWFLPYTVLAVSLWIWSGGKSISALRNAGLIAPVLFFLLILAEASLVYLLTDDFSEFAQGLSELSLFLGVSSIVFGYLCVGIALGVFKALQIKNLIAQETPLEN